MKSIELLSRYGIEWNAMAVVNNLNVVKPDEFYDFFCQIGCRYLQFTPVVERITDSGRLASYNQSGILTAESVTPEHWGEFLCRVFDRWVCKDVGRIFVQLFDATLASWLGEAPGLCSMSAVCGHAGVMERNGDIYSCDHFVFPDYRLGNIHKWSESIAVCEYENRESVIEVPTVRLLVCLLRGMSQKPFCNRQRREAELLMRRL